MTTHTIRNILGTLCAIFALGATVSAADAAIVTFDTGVSPTSTYTESGMTFTSVSGSQFEVSSGFGGFGWNVPCCPDEDDVFELTTGGLFDLLSIDVVHADSGDPITFEGYFGSSLVNSFVLADGIERTIEFVGFTGLDLVRVTASGFSSDPTFDNLSYELAAVPLPAALPMLGAGLGFFGLIGSRRRRSA